jgi:hypothetical protein
METGAASAGKASAALAAVPSTPVALAEGSITSLDDAAQKYVVGLAGTPYGETPIRHLLTMSSGVRFVEITDAQKAWLSRVLNLRETLVVLFCMQNCDNRRSIDNDHFGKPCSS